MSGRPAPVLRDRFTRLRSSVPTVIVLAAVSIAALALFALFLFAAPQSDDFCRAALRLDNKTVSFWEYWTDRYLHWTGRWATMLVHLTVMTHLDLFRWYGLLLASVALLTLGGLGVFFRSVLRCTSRAAALLAIGLYAFVFMTTGSPGEILYWLTGSFEYQLPLATVLTFLGLMFSTRKWTVARSVACVALAFLIPGQHELAGILALVVLWAGVLVKRREGTLDKTWVAASVAVFIGLAISAGAPGNAARSATLPGVWTFASIAGGLKLSAVTLASWFVSGPLLCGFAVVAANAHNWRIVPDWVTRREIRAAVPIFGFFLAALQFTIPAMTYRGQLGPARAVTWAYTMFALVCLLTAVAWSGTFASLQHSLGCRCILAALFAAALLSTPTAKGVFKDLLPGTAARWHQSYAKRQYSTGRDRLFEPALLVPQSYSFTDIETDRANWRNRCMAAYLGADSVALRQENPARP